MRINGSIVNVNLCNKISLKPYGTGTSRNGVWTADFGDTVTVWCDTAIVLAIYTSVYQFRNQKFWIVYNERNSGQPPPPGTTGRIYRNPYSDCTRRRCRCCRRCGWNGSSPTRAQCSWKGPRIKYLCLCLLLCDLEWTSCLYFGNKRYQGFRFVACLSCIAIWLDYTNTALISDIYICDPQFWNIQRGLDVRVCLNPYGWNPGALKTAPSAPRHLLATPGRTTRLTRLKRCDYLSHLSLSASTYIKLLAYTDLLALNYWQFLVWCSSDPGGQID